MKAGRLAKACRGLTALVLLTLVACGGGERDGATGAAVSPPLRPVAEERAAAKKALVVVADLGRPWVQETSQSRRTGKKGEFCPGQPSEAVLAPARATASSSFTEGTQKGAAIGAFTVETLYPGQEGAWRQAIATKIEGCQTFRDANGLFVTATAVDTPPPVPGADEVVAYVERIHQDIEHKKLLYVRHYVHARSGRLVSTAQYAVVQPKSDPTGSDLTQVTKLASMQAAKAEAAFGL